MTLLSAVRTVRRLAGILLLVSSAAAAQSLPPLIHAPQAAQPIQLVAAAIKAEVAGTLATTRIELTFLNPNPRQLEGELQFPLLDGQDVTGFALESLDGQMLPAVPVSKRRGQEVFESIERRGADPALLEQTLGNNFKLRVYPLMPGKARRVSLEISELLLPDRDGRVSYRLPLNLGADTKLSLAIKLHGLAADKVRLAPELRGAEVVSRHGDALVLLERARFASQNLIGLSWPAQTVETVFSDRFDGADFFHAEIPLDLAPAPRPAPKALALIWDASGSGAARDYEREFALLDAYFKTFARLKVTLLLAREKATDVAEPPHEFTIVDGNWQALRAALQAVAYDGASNPAAWHVPAGVDADIALLFSDGLANWGSGRAAGADRTALPLYAVNAAAAGNANLLRELAESSTGGGQYLDLNRLETAQAVAELQQIRPRFQVGQVSGIADLVAPSLYPQQGRLRLAGRLTQADATLNYSLQLADGKFTQHSLRIQSAPESIELVAAVAAKRWAGYRIAQLEARRHLHSAEIERLGSRFGLVSSQTSLLVLESLDDYLRYRITPPAGPLRNEYLARSGKTEADSPAQRSRHLDDLARRFGEVVAWWQRDFPKDAPPKLVAKAEPAAVGAAVREAVMGDMRASESRRASAAPAAAMQPMALMAAPSPVPAAAGNPVAAAGATPAQASIQLQKWQPDAAYAQRLRAANDAERYAVYLDELPGHRNSTAFFLDAADVFFDKGQTDLALRVLSNLAEIDLESRHVLRILAYRLLQAGQTQQALPLLQRVRELAPEEPQSWRDLGLALAADGQGQAALDALWETAARPWDGRFTDIDLTALAELNALIARTPGLDSGRIDPRLLRNLPLDLRAVLAWDADNTDIDLWVIDPNGEKTYYGHPLSYQGGKLSRDFTAGYGPETYSLKTAKPGRYEIRAQFYGHRQQVLSPYTTLMLRLSTGFGTAAQKDANVTLRLSGQKDEVLVGSFEVAGK